MSTAGKKILDGLKDAVAGNFSRVHIPDADGKLQTWVRIDKEEDVVTLSRAQYEALMGAAKATLRSFWGPPMRSHGECACVDCEGRRSAAALRAAGIETEGEAD